MSQLFTASPKHCAKKGFHIPKLNKKLLYAISSFSFTTLSLVFLIWFMLHPSKPEFYLKDADVYQLSLSSPHLLNSTIQFTLVSKNPNSRVGVYYNQLRAYASYKGQQITTDSELPEFYQGHEESNQLSASLVGISVPVAPSFGYEVSRDQTAGKLLLKLRLDGQLRWKVGNWVSGWYWFGVDCVAIIDLGTGDFSGPLSSKQGSQCSTNV